MSLSVRPFTEKDAGPWDTFCQSAFQSTLLHTRLFLSYHGDRFIDCSLIIEEEGEWLGLFPAALNAHEPTCVTSHPGITYGGVLHQGRLQGIRMIEALKIVQQYYIALGYSKLLYKAVPAFYHRWPAQDDLYALFRLGAQRIRCDISSTIDLQNRRLVSQRRKRGFKKAIKTGIAIIEGTHHLAALWEVLTYNLANKHRAKPVHSLAEITSLAQRFPENIRCVCGVIDNMVVAGIVLFITPIATHAQYIASSQYGYEISALDAIFEHCINAALNEGKRWFDFGISTDQGGLLLNEGLYDFKTEFGGGGTVHEFFELDMEK